MKNKRLKKSLKDFSQKKEDKLTLIVGELGIPLSGDMVVEVPGRAGFVFVRLKGNTSELIQAYNAVVSPIYGLPVLVARQNNIYKIVGRDLDRYQDWGTEPYLPRHGTQHSFNHALGMGGDITWVYSQQWMPLLAYPSGTEGSMHVSINPHFYEWSGLWKYAQNTGTPDLSPYVPSSDARMVLVYLDGSDNSIKAVPGTPFANTITGSAEVSQYIPNVPRSVGIPLGAVRLVSGTTAIMWDAIYDVRPFYVGGSTSGSSGGGGGISGISAWDEGIPLGTGTIFNFVGSNVEASISGSVVRVFVTGSSGGTVNPPVTGSVVIQDNGTTLGSATILNAGTRMSASLSGSVALFDTDFALLRHDDLTSQVNGTGTRFSLTYTPEANTTRLFYNGVRQRFSFHYVISGSHVHTLFTPSTGSVLLADYNEFTSTGTNAGAPSDAKYVVTESNDTLSAEVVIPGLAGSADIKQGGVVAYEFDSGASPLTWSAAVDTENVNSTVKSHLYVQDNGASETLGTADFSRTGTFDIRCKISVGAEEGTSTALPACGLVVGDSAMNNRVLVLLYFSGSNDRYQIDAYTFTSSTYTQRGASNTGMANCVYLRITRDNSNNVSMYWSSDGITWLLIATQSFTYTQAKVGLRLAPASITTTVAVDWIRSY